MAGANAVIDGMKASVDANRRQDLASKPPAELTRDEAIELQHLKQADYTDLSEKVKDTDVLTAEESARLRTYEAEIAAHRSARQQAKVDAIHADAARVTGEAIARERAAARAAAAEREAAQQAKADAEKRSAPRKPTAAELTAAKAPVWQILRAYTEESKARTDQLEAMLHQLKWHDSDDDEPASASAPVVDSSETVRHMRKEEQAKVEAATPSSELVVDEREIRHRLLDPMAMTERDRQALDEGLKNANRILDIGRKVRDETGSKVLGGIAVVGQELNEHVWQPMGEIMAPAMEVAREVPIVGSAVDGLTVGMAWVHGKVEDGLTHVTGSRTFGEAVAPTVTQVALAGLPKVPRALTSTGRAAANVASKVPGVKPGLTAAGTVAKSAAQKALAKLETPLSVVHAAAKEAAQWRPDVHARGSGMIPLVRKAAPAPTSAVASEVAAAAPVSEVAGVSEAPLSLTTAAKGSLGEARAAATLDFADYTSLPCRLPGNKGIDHVFVKYDTTGAVSDVIVVQDVVVVESKYATKGGAPRLAKSGPVEERVQQLSDKWMKKQMEAMYEHHPETHRFLKENKSKIRFKANVLDEHGTNRWYDYGKFDPEGASASAVRSTKPTDGGTK